MLGVAGDQVPVAMADPYGGDLYQNFSITRFCQINLFDSERLARSVEDSGTYFHFRNLPS